MSSPAQKVFNPFSQKIVQGSKTLNAFRRLGFDVDKRNPYRLIVGPHASAENLQAIKDVHGQTWRSKVREIVAANVANPIGALEIFLRDANNVRANALLPTQLRQHQEAFSSPVDLTPDQSNVVQLAMKGYNLYIGGSAGTGKTVALKEVHRALVQQKQLSVALCATTGVAGVHLGGCTFHHAFSVPLREGDCWDVDALRVVDVIIIDEVSLLRQRLLETLDAKARDARLDPRPFGGIQVILCGDFLQLTMDTTGEFPQPCFFSPLMQHIVSVQLVTPMRHKEGDPLYKLLSHLRVGQYDPIIETLSKEPQGVGPRDLIHLFPMRKDARLVNERHLEELCEKEAVFVPTRGPLQLCGSFTQTLIVTTEASPQELGEALTSALCVPGQSQARKARVCVMPCSEASHHYAVRARQPSDGTSICGGEWKRMVSECLRSLHGAIVGEEKVEDVAHVPQAVSTFLVESADPTLLEPLKLKIGCRVMITRNLSPTVCNGTICTIIAFLPLTESLLPAGYSLGRAMNGVTDRASIQSLPVVETEDGTVFQVPLVGMSIGGNADTFFYGHDVHILPLQLAYAFTVHKVQGLTLSQHVVLDCTHFFKCEHLLYVACSRVKKIEQLTVKGVTREMVCVNRHALQFSQSLDDASRPVHPRPDIARAAWFEDAPCSTSTSPAALAA